MRFCRGFVVAVAVFVLAGALPALAAWSTDTEVNLRLTTTDTDGYAYRGISDGLGGFIVTWYAGNIPEDGNEVYGQRVDATGELMWGDEGLTIAADTTDEAYPRVCSDGAGGGIFVWTVDNGTYLKAQKVNAAGVVQWQANGIEVRDGTENNVYCPFLAPDGSGGAFIVWNETTIMCQRVTSAGALAWAEPVAMGDSGSFAVKVAADGSGGAIAIWQGSTPSRYGTLYAQRLDADGDPQWGPSGLCICDDSGTPQCPRVKIDDIGNAYFLWNDYRSETGKLYVQKVLSSGLVAWTANGVLAGDGDSDSYGHAFVLDEDGGVIVTWLESTDANLYANRINSLGAEEWGGAVALTDDGDVSDVSDTPEQLVPDGEGGAMIAYMLDGGTVMAQRVTVDGAVPWGLDGKVLCNIAEASTGCIRSMGCPAGEGGLLAYWIDYRTAYGIYVMGIAPDGTVGDPCVALTPPTPTVIPTPFDSPATTPAGLAVLLAAFGFVIAIYSRRNG